MAAPIRFEMLNTIPTSGIRSIKEATNPKTAACGSSGGDHPFESREAEQPPKERRLTSVGDFSLSHPELDLRGTAIPQKCQLGWTSLVRKAAKSARARHLFRLEQLRCSRGSQNETHGQKPVRDAAMTHRLVEMPAERESADRAEDAQTEAGNEAEWRQEDCGGTKEWSVTRGNPEPKQRHKRTFEEEHADEGAREARVERLLLGGAGRSLYGRDEPLLRVRLPPIIRCGEGPPCQSIRVKE